MGPSRVRGIGVIASTGLCTYRPRVFDKRRLPMKIERGKAYRTRKRRLSLWG